MSWRERGGDAVGRRAWIETETEMEMEMVSQRLDLRYSHRGQERARYPYMHSL